MIVGVLKEIKKQEYRVGLTPDGAGALTRTGTRVLVEHTAGEGSGFSDAAYESAGAVIADRQSVALQADLIVKVKEPLESEFALFRPGQTLFTYLHLAPDRGLTDVLLEKRVTALAYETLEVHGELPLLRPMSEVAGRMAPMVGAYFLQKPHGGTGVLPSGVPGTPPGKIVILGAGTVGRSACRTAVGLGMDVVVLNRSVERLAALDDLYHTQIRTGPLQADAVERETSDADIVVGALLVPGGRTPILISKSHLSRMKPGAVIVDVSIDQGGCAETSLPRTHDDPVYKVDGVTHYTVANMPGAYPRTSTVALTNATLPWIQMLARLGVARALEVDGSVRSALNLFDGRIMHRGIAEAQGRT